MKIVSFIPIKLNNQRLPGKNTMLLNGRPMCDYIFKTICEVDSIDEKYVYCSDESIKSYMPEKMTFLKRDTYLDGFQVKGLEIIDRFVKDVDADIYVLTHVTQPFTKASSIETALQKVVSGEYDSAFSVIELQDYMWKDGKYVQGEEISPCTASVTINLMQMNIKWESGYIYCYAFLEDDLQPFDEKVRGPESITVVFDPTKQTDQW